MRSAFTRREFLTGAAGSLILAREGRSQADVPTLKWLPGKAYHIPK